MTVWSWPSASLMNPVFCLILTVLLIVEVWAYVNEAVKLVVIRID